MTGRGGRAARAVLSAAASVVLVFVLAGAPVLVTARAGRPAFDAAGFAAAYLDWSRGLADGGSFDYTLGSTTWSLLEQAPKFLAVSVANLTLPGAVGIFFGALAGALSRPRRRGWADRLVDGLAATPDFMLALALQVLAAGVLAPLGLRVRIGPSSAGLSLPAMAVMAAYPFCFAYRAAVRASRSTRGADFVAFARAKGLSEGAILRRHVGAAVVPALVDELPVILAFMQGTLFIVEYLFALPGVARFLFSAAFSGPRRGFYQTYQYDLGVFVLAGLCLAYTVVYAVLRLALALARKVLAHE